MPHHERYNQAKKVTLISVGVNILLGIIKLIGGVLFHSHALIADGLHSFSDLVIDITILFASKYGSQDADASHPYGHQRIETASTLLLALLLIFTGMGIVWDCIDHIIQRHATLPGALALPIAALSIFANEGLFYYTRHVGKRIRSDLIIANAWHHRSDAASSLVVLIGIIGSMAGLADLDALAAIIVGIMIIQMGWSYGWNSVKELVDTAVEPQMISTIERLILEVDGVHKIHQLRTRSMGSDIFIDVHIQVSPYISVSEGHFIAQHVHNTLVDEIERVRDVTVHVDPEDDETCSPSLHLQNRKVLEHTLLERWVTDYPDIQYWILHYLDGTLTIDLILNQKFTQWKNLASYIHADLETQGQNVQIRLFNEHPTEKTC